MKAPLASKYFVVEGDEVRCVLCPRRCKLREGEVGSCGVRQNRGGEVVLVTYGECTSIAVDPIEKKPLFHFYPGSVILSVGAVGCNLHCVFCQNWEISQERPPTHYCPPEQLVARALEVPHNLGIAYTYNEPLIWFEFVLDAARLAHERGLKNVLVTNGTVNPEPLQELLPYIDAMNVDLKSIRQSFYSEMCDGFLRATQATIQAAWGNCLVEVTNLLIPGYNDSDQDLEDLTDWVAGVSPDVPLHFSRYFPAHKLRVPPTPEATLMRAIKIGQRKLNYVYLGNLRTPGGEHTHCKSCHKVIVARSGYLVEGVKVHGGRCDYCGAENYLAN
jgi:pyruvate formate lyase activating enzyme